MIIEKAARLIGYISLLLFLAATFHLVWQLIFKTNQTPYSIYDAIAIIVTSYYTMSTMAGILLAIDHNKPEDDWQKEIPPIKAVPPYWE